MQLVQLGLPVITNQNAESCGLLIYFYFGGGGVILCGEVIRFEPSNVCVH